MQANCTNSNPCVIAAYFVQAVTKLEGCARILRSDHGTENVHANRLQNLFREDDTGEVHGPSCVIQYVDYWRDVFREFQATVDFSGDFIDKGVIQFCFLKIIQVSHHQIMLCVEQKKIK